MPTMTEITPEDSILRTFVLFMQATQVRVILDVERGGRKEFARAVMPRNDSANQDGGGTMTSQGPNWRDSLRKSTPEILDRVIALQESTTKDGALSLKTKTLMMMLCDALLGHPDGVANIARRARSLGASENEIAETAAVAFLMGGLPSLVTASSAFREQLQ